MSLRITYIGHATLLLEIGGIRVLTDPNFDSALGRFLARVSAPGIPLAGLGRLDLVLVTHAHADHLSLDSLRAITGGAEPPPVIAPPSVAGWLAREGFSRVEALAPGGTARVGGVTLHAAAATHMGARYGYDRWRADANMYLLDADDRSLFFAGDTGLTPDTHRLARERLAEGRAIDVALLPIGHAPWWKLNFRRGHLTSEDALLLWERLGAQHLVPYHWGTFNHVTSTAFDAIDRFRLLVQAHARGADVRILEPGAALEL